MSTEHCICGHHEMFHDEQGCGHNDDCHCTQFVEDHDFDPTPFCSYHGSKKNCDCDKYRAEND